MGQEKYSSVLSEMIGYIEGKQARSKDINSIKDIINKKDKVGSWIDLFFKDDIHILGFKFYYTEIDLWWLINKRARLINNRKDKINNTIYYYTKDYDSETNILDSLETHNIKVVSFKNELSYQEFYKQAFETIRKNMS